MPRCALSHRYRNGAVSVGDLEPGPRDFHVGDVRSGCSGIRKAYGLRACRSYGNLSKADGVGVGRQKPSTRKRFLAAVRGGRSVAYATRQSYARAHDQQNWHEGNQTAK